MRCLVCGDWVGTSPACACGFDAETKELGPVLVRARRDLRSARLHLAAGAIGASALIALAAGVGPDIFIELIQGLFLVICASVYGLAVGTKKYLDAHRRFTVASEMRALPAARVVQRDR